jgi:isopentenyl phosphate kinase
LRPDVLHNLVAVIAQYQSNHPDDLLIIGHGAGSFAHVPATRYRTIDGFVDQESRLGMAIVQDSAAQLNRLVVTEFLQQGLPAVSVCPSSSLVTNHKEPQFFFDNVFREYLHQGLLPITYGDVIVDSAIGCTIWSTDMILAFFAQQFLHHQWPIKKIIHVTQVPGVLKNVDDVHGELFTTINNDNAEVVKRAMGVTAGFDVTGGMWHKIQESLRLTQYGVETDIISGSTPDNLQACLLDKPFVGTRIIGNTQ